MHLEWTTPTAALPLLVMLTIPFAVGAVIITFFLHGITLIDFFAAIGVLGLAGVIVNDSIIMTERMLEMPNIVEAARSRLRAVILTTVTTVVALLPTAYGWIGQDAMLSQMMLAVSWGLLFGTMITLYLIPLAFSFIGNHRNASEGFA